MIARAAVGIRTVSWPRLLAVMLPPIGLALLADSGLSHWMTATASGLVTAVALAAAVAMLGPVQHSRLFLSQGT
jgi:hypothetical protein